MAMSQRASAAPSASGRARRGPRLGELLVGRGRVTKEGLRKTLKLQAELGGRLGTNLLELGLIDEERLLVTLGEQRETSTVSGSELRHAHPAVVKSIPAKLARRYGIVPFELRGNTLHVACRDLTDVLVEDEVRMLTGYMMRSFLSLELRIYEALELYYRAPPQVRFQALIRRLDDRREEPEADLETAAPPSEIPLSLRPSPRQDSSRRSVNEGRQRPPTPAAQPEAPRFIELNAEEEALLRRSAAESATSEVPAQAPDPPSSEAPSSEAPAVSLPPTATPPPPSPAAERAPRPAEDAAASDEERLQEATRALRDAEIRDEIAEVLLDFCAPYFRRRLLLIQRQGRIVGWRGSGEGVLGESVRAIEIPADEPSVFANVRQSGNFWLGPLPPLEANRTLELGLGGSHPKTCLVLPITVRAKTIGYLYGDNAGEGVAGAPVAVFRRLLAKTSIAFEIYILKNKMRMI